MAVSATKVRTAAGWEEPGWLLSGVGGAVGVQARWNECVSRHASSLEGSTSQRVSFTPPPYFSVTLSQYCEGLVEVLLLGKLAEEEPKRV